ncbi:hypothetical protein JK203_14785 [Gluconobacter cerinus]|nr:MULTISPECIES: hypothetical protein [Gluconobacter]MBS1019983.1 hypothetical protein [Gluconobacter cerinus]MBS1036016.1 hypothetical protein [Gluconobacter cerinus]MBS1042095.1 hypothetical protein [Gluconobacter cerinus]MBS1048686.1 hypothetical protein [Gluconobacter cerinus]MBS1069501.1 hypothetical protein [Gluconobacter cerinus]
MRDGNLEDPGGSKTSPWQGYGENVVLIAIGYGPPSSCSVPKVTGS